MGRQPLLIGIGIIAIVVAAFIAFGPTGFVMLQESDYPYIDSFMGFDFRIDIDNNVRNSVHTLVENPNAQGFLSLATRGPGGNCPPDPGGGTDPNAGQSGSYYTQFTNLDARTVDKIKFWGPLHVEVQDCNEKFGGMGVTFRMMLTDGTNDVHVYTMEDSITYEGGSQCANHVKRDSDITLIKRNEDSFSVTSGAGDSQIVYATTLDTTKPWHVKIFTSASGQCVSGAHGVAQLIVEELEVIYSSEADCQNNNDCDDEDTCTEDICIEGTCENTRINDPDCQTPTEGGFSWKYVLAGILALGGLGVGIKGLGLI